MGGDLVIGRGTTQQEHQLGGGGLKTLIPKHIKSNKQHQDMGINHEKE